MPFSLQYKQFVELVETLTELITQTHNSYIATSVLHDGPSNFWSDTKEFYEVSILLGPITSGYKLLILSLNAS